MIFYKDYGPCWGMEELLEKIQGSFFQSGAEVLSIETLCKEHRKHVVRVWYRHVQPVY